MITELNKLIEQGGWIIPLLLGLSILGLGVALWRSLSLFLLGKNLKKTAKLISKQSELELFLLESQTGFVIIRVIASISPLLGLLGTVLGLLEAFDAIASTGLGDPGIFAAGISKALLTTIAGLLVAIPHLIALNLLERQADLLVARLECAIHGIEESS